MTSQFYRLQSKLGTWTKFIEDWQSQCEALGEDFSSYEVEPIGVVRDLAEGADRDDAAAYALTLAPGCPGQARA
jgi:hypothetical protein